MRYIVSLLVLLIAFNVNAGERNKLDSLLAKEHTFKKDTNGVKNYIAIAGRIKKRNFDSSVIYSIKAMKLAAEINSPYFYVKARIEKANNLKVTGDLKLVADSALSVYGDPRLQEFPMLMIRLCQDMGVNYRYMANYDKSIKYLLEALALSKKINLKNGIYNSYNSLANTYSQAGIVKKSRVDLERALENYGLAKQHMDTTDLKLKGMIMNNQGVTYFNLGQAMKDSIFTRHSISYYRASLECRKIIKDSVGLASNYNNIGSVYHDLYNLTKHKPYLFESTANYEKAIEICKSQNMPELYTFYVNYGGNLSMMAAVTGKKEFLQKALDIFREAYATSVKNHDNYNMMLSVDGLARTYTELKQYDSAIGYYNKYISLKDTILSSENKQIAEDLAMKYESDLKDTENKNLKEQAELREEVISKKSATINIMVIGSVILLGLMVLVFISRQMINQQKKESDLQKRIIEEKNKEITDSINYAKRLQNAILTTDKTMQSVFKESFVFYKPKDIVSGDFYWMFHIEERNQFIVTAADCTGHGVPGAFMSMLNSTLLNQTAYNPTIVTPADALNFLNRELPKNLRSSNENEHINDGMDIAFCLFDLNTNVMTYAGANNPCWIIRNKELIELKPLKQAITAATDYEKKQFANQEIPLQEGDVIYLFTDGYADQFGGPDGKKLKYKSLADLLINIHEKPAIEQRNLLEQHFNAWKGQLEQVDDVLVVGLKY